MLIEAQLGQLGAAERRSTSGLLEQVRQLKLNAFPDAQNRSFNAQNAQASSYSGVQAMGLLSMAQSR